MYGYGTCSCGDAGTHFPSSTSCPFRSHAVAFPFTLPHHSSVLDAVGVRVTRWHLLLLLRLLPRPTRDRRTRSGTRYHGGPLFVTRATGTWTAVPRTPRRLGWDRSGLSTRARLHTYLQTASEWENVTYRSRHSDHRPKCIKRNVFVYDYRP